MTERESETKLADDPDTIWLQPLCCVDERAWCSCDPGPCEDCGMPSIKYTRAALSQPSGSGVPVAWTIPGDDAADANGFITARVTEEGEFTKPLYASPSEGQAARDAGLEGWQPIETAPTDGRRLWISDGKDVWHITAHADGSHRHAKRCKFWMDAHWPAPPALKSTPPKGSGGHQQNMTEEKI